MTTPKYNGGTYCPSCANGCKKCNGTGFIHICACCDERFEDGSGLTYAEYLDDWICAECVALNAAEQAALDEASERRAKTIERHTERGAA